MFDVKTILQKYDGCSTETLMEGVRLATESACRRYFRTSRCYVDMHHKGVTVEFVLPNDKAAIESIKAQYGVEYDEYDIMVPVFMPLNNLPKRIINMTRNDLVRAINAVKEKEIYNKWRNKRNTLVEGVVSYDTGNDFIEVNVDGTTCILQKRYMIKQEAKYLYKIGKTAYFHVIKVQFGKKDTCCKIMLSRRSLIFPQHLLKTILPMYRFKCVKRYPGNISWIETTAPFKDKNVIKAIKEVSKELSGEIIKLVEINH